MFTFGTLTIDKREYSEKDIRGLKPISEFGLDDSFYGGRVAWIGETDTDVLLIVENKDGLKVIDTGAVNLENINKTHLVDLAKKRKLEIKDRATKKEIIQALSA